MEENESVEKSKKKKSNAIVNALLIGFLIGIVIYSAAVNSLGFFTLIPLFFIYKLINKPKGNKTLQ